MNAAEKPEASATPAKKPATRSKPKTRSDWTNLVTRPESVPRAEAEHDEVPAAERETYAEREPAPVVHTQVNQLVRPATKAGTFRLPLDAHEIINQAIAEEAALGNRLTKDAAVTDALRTWEKARARRKKG